MLEQPQHKYNLRYSKKRSREPKQQEESTPQVTPPILNKGKGKLNPNPARIKVTLNKERNGSGEHKTKEAPVL